MFVIAQILGGIATVLLLWYTLREVDRRTIVFFNLLVNCLWCAHYFLLEAYTSTLCSILCVAMYFVFRMKKRNRFLSGMWIPAFFAVCFVAFGIITWDGPISILPVVCNLALSIAMWIDNAVLIKAVCIPVSAMWVIYNALVLSYTGMVGQSLFCLCNIVYVVRHFRKHSA